MKKAYAVCALFILILLVSGYENLQNRNRVAAQEQVVPVAFSFESDHMSMVEIGQMLERMGREMQQNGDVTFAGNAYPLTGYGGIEFSISRRVDREGNLRTGFELGFGSSGSTGPPTNGKAYTQYETGGRRTPTRGSRVTCSRSPGDC